MSRKLSILVLVLLAALTGCQKGDEVAIKLRSDYLSADAGSSFFAVTASGAWTLSVEFPAGVEPWLSVTPASGSGSMNNAILKYSANAEKTSRSATVVMTPASGTPARAALTQAGKAESVVGNYGYDVASMDWLELPACKADDGREVLVHDMKGGKYVSKDKSGVRNFSCYWDYKAHMSLWVAYPLNNSIKGSGTGRTETWGYDPLLPASIQPDIRNGSYGGGWTRGHQLPSADRQRSTTENATTYYSTNMTPQDYDFNAGIWARLEGKVRNYASSADTLYVVTGALWESSSRVSGSSSGFAVRIPTHYFKALLYKGSSAYAKDTQGYMMAGFILPHDTGISNGNCLDYRVTIDELEARTGIDFFPNLEKRNETLSKQLESAAPNAQFWN
jgi:endonuclease G